MRFPSQLGQIPRRLHENATNWSLPRPSHRTLTKPRLSCPQSTYALNAFPTNAGSPRPSFAARVRENRIGLAASQGGCMGRRPNLRGGDGRVERAVRARVSLGAPARQAFGLVRACAVRCQTQRGGLAWRRGSQEVRHACNEVVRELVLAGGRVVGGVRRRRRRVC